MKRVARRSRFPGCRCIVHYVSALHTEIPQQQQIYYLCEAFVACRPAARHFNVKLAKRLPLSDPVHFAHAGADLSLGHVPFKLECRSKTLLWVLQVYLHLCVSMGGRSVCACYMRACVSEEAL